MNKSRIYPNWDQIGNLKTELTQGERTLALYLDHKLPYEWDIFLQPFMNGDRPDIVIFNPNVGLVIYEVKDWLPNIYSSKLVQKQHGASKFTTLEFSVNAQMKNQKIANPLYQVKRYRDKLVDIYEPEIGEAINENFRTIRAFRTVLFFSKLKSKELDTLFHNGKYNRGTYVIGKDELNAMKLPKVVPDIEKTNSKFMFVERAKKIRTWLIPPKNSIEQLQKITLSKEQETHTIPSPQKHQRLKGVVGSGKTLVIAQRAANLAANGKNVLIVTFNITLWHYIRDKVSRARYGFNWDKVEFTHFHGFCRDYLSENDLPWPDDHGNTDHFLNKELANIVYGYKKSGKNVKDRQYDAILIDEGQDFEKEWYLLLCEFLTKNDEVLFVSDELQNIYKRDQSWLNNMTGTKFRGRWRVLNKSYRLPPKIIEKTNEFAEQFIPNIDVKPIPAEYQMDLFEPHIIWRNLVDNNRENFKDAAHAIGKTLEFFHEIEIHPGDIAILVPEHKEGWLMIDILGKYNYTFDHVFEDEKRKHYHKKAFWMGGGKTKASTIHSFKGWEIRNLIVLTPKYATADYDKVLYTALTRVQENLVVINRSQRYKNYGNKWPDNWVE